MMTPKTLLLLILDFENVTFESRKKMEVQVNLFHIVKTKTACFNIRSSTFHNFDVNLYLFQNWRAQSQMIAPGHATKLQRLCLIWFWKG